MIKHIECDKKKKKLHLYRVFPCQNLRYAYSTFIIKSKTITKLHVLM